jgi:hypothetical protein
MSCRVRCKETGACCDESVCPLSKPSACRGDCVVMVDFEEEYEDEDV